MPVVKDAFTSQPIMSADWFATEATRNIRLVDDAFTFISKNVILDEGVLALTAMLATSVPRKELFTLLLDLDKTIFPITYTTPAGGLSKTEAGCVAGM
jgi:hypothetical protein